MRMINAKYPITELNINNIIKSNLSPVERYWLKSKIKKFIKYEDI